MISRIVSTASTAVLLALLLCPALVGAQAAIPVRVQGNVQNNSAPLTGNHAMTFRIYDAPTGGAQLWSETHPSVQFSNGIYSLSIGETNPLTGIFNGPTNQRWLSIQIGTDPEFSPRQQMIATPYANYAVNAGNATSLGGQSISYFSTKTESVQNNAESLGLLRGTITGIATVAAGAGFTCTSPALGEYNITFASGQEFSGMPTVTATPNWPNGFLSITAASNTGFTVTVRNSNGTPDMVGFHFIAVGPRAIDADGDGVIASLDCDDSNGSIYPGAPEISCNGIDEDCNGTDDTTGAPTWHLDSDGDSFGDPSSTIVACTAPTNYVSDGTDCDDSTANVYPGAPENPTDGMDNDCDGTVDEGGPMQTWYVDADGDGYGDPSASTSAVTVPPGHVADNTDCDDSNASVHPGATEVCNGADDDCDTSVDEGVVTMATWYLDQDGDTYGNPSLTVVSCTAPSGYVANGTDCDDANAAVNPGALEVCDNFGVDEDCDGMINEPGASGTTTWYMDSDADGYGGPSSIQACAQPVNYVSNNFDCDDSDSSVHPGAVEICGNGVDEDCDGIADNGC